MTAAMIGKIAKPVVIAWFDADRAGDGAWLRLRKMLALWPTNLHRLTSKKEPKHCHRSEIVAKLEGLS